MTLNDEYAIEFSYSFQNMIKMPYLSRAFHMHITFMENHAFSSVQHYILGG